MAFGCIDVTYYVYLFTALLILFLMPIVLLFTLFTLFAEPRVGKAWAKRLEEDARSHRDDKSIYCLLAGSAAIAEDRLYSLLLWLTQQTQPWRSSHASTFQVELISAQHTTLDQASTLWHDVQCYKCAQLLHSHYLQSVRSESLKTPSWLICSLPTFTNCVDPSLGLSFIKLL